MGKNVTDVTLPVEELAKLVKHADAGKFWFNLRRDLGQYHRCLEVRMIEEQEPVLEFRLMLDNREVALVRHKMDDLFGLLPRLRQWLEEEYARP